MRIAGSCESDPVWAYPNVPDPEEFFKHPARLTPVFFNWDSAYPLVQDFAMDQNSQILLGGNTHEVAPGTSENSVGIQQHEFSELLQINSAGLQGSSGGPLNLTCLQRNENIQVISAADSNSSTLQQISEQLQKMSAENQILHHLVRSQSANYDSVVRSLEHVQGQQRLQTEVINATVTYLQSVEQTLVKMSEASRKYESLLNKYGNLQFEFYTGRKMISKALRKSHALTENKLNNIEKLLLTRRSEGNVAQQSHGGGLNEQQRHPPEGFGTIRRNQPKVDQIIPRRSEDPNVGPADVANPIVDVTDDVHGASKAAAGPTDSMETQEISSASIQKSANESEPETLSFRSQPTERVKLTKQRAPVEQLPLRRSPRFAAPGNQRNVKRPRSDHVES